MDDYSHLMRNMQDNAAAKPKAGFRGSRNRGELLLLAGVATMEFPLNVP
jgi:hypothetical protein